MRDGLQSKRHVVWTLVSGMFLAGCVDVNGGAVELSWAIRAANGDALDIDNCVSGTGIASVQLCIQDCDQIVDGACGGPRVCPVDAWDCDRFHGTTGFDIAPGRKALSIDVKCADGSDAAVSVPEPLVRDVVHGEVTQLNALLIAVQPADTTQACSVH